MRILFIGDIVGKPGRDIVCRAIGPLREQERLDFIIANAENSAGGSGLTPANYRELTSAGVDCITLGDHIYRRKEIEKILATKDNIVKPANYPAGAPGRTWTVLTTASGEKIAVVSLIGRVFMKPVDCPFLAADRVLAELPPEVNVIFVDMHAEATSDKQLMGRYLDGRVSAVLGTHTHVPTADAQIFPGGTAFQCDVGMTGPYESILGRRIDRVTQATVTFLPTPFDVAKGDVRILGSIVDIDDSTGRATAITPAMFTESDVEALGENDAGADTS